MDVLEDLACSNPVLATLVMHEFNRNLYPADPHIPFPTGVSHRDRILGVISRLTSLSQAALQTLHIYPVDSEQSSVDQNLKERTGALYSRLWSGYSSEDYVREGVNLLKKRLGTSENWSTVFRGVGLDAGCGSGRFSLALAEIGASEVVGVDWSVEGFRKGKAIAEV